MEIIKLKKGMFIDFGFGKFEIKEISKKHNEIILENNIIIEYTLFQNNYKQYKSINGINANQIKEIILN